MLASSSVNVANRCTPQSNVGQAEIPTERSKGSHSGYLLGTETPWNDAQRLEVLTEAHPDVPAAQLKYLLEISKGDANAVSDLFLQGLTLQSLVNFLKTACFPMQSVNRLTIDEYGNPESLTQEAIAFYKGSRFSPSAEICISIGNQPVVDTGGVRRQFFCNVFTHISTSTSLRLFEGSENRLRPVFRQSSIASGILTVVGKMVGHSIIMDCQGFPFLSPACYYCMAGFMDKAVSVASIVDAGEHVQEVVSQVRCVH